MDTIEIPVYLVRTLRPDGYISRFYDLISASGLNHREAYEAIEGERTLFGLPEAYTSYESFKSAKCRLMRINTK